MLLTGLLSGMWDSSKLCAIPGQLPVSPDRMSGTQTSSVTERSHTLWEKPEGMA